VITELGVAVGVLVPPAAVVTEVERLHGFLRGSVAIPPAVDLAALVADEPFAAARGEIHG
jgi:hypothetical protein